jgi:hypothetical protein
MQSAYLKRLITLTVIIWSAFHWISNLTFANFYLWIHTCFCPIGFKSFNSLRGNSNNMWHLRGKVVSKVSSNITWGDGGLAKISSDNLYWSFYWYRLIKASVMSPRGAGGVDKWHKMSHRERGCLKSAEILSHNIWMAPKEHFSYSLTTFCSKHSYICFVLHVCFLIFCFA